MSLFEEEDVEPEPLNMSGTMREVMTACQEVRLLHPASPARLESDISRPLRRLASLQYTLQNGAGFLKFFSYYHDPDCIIVTVWPMSLFQQRVLPGDLCFTSLNSTHGFLDPPRNSIYFDNFQMVRNNTHPTPVARLTLTGAERCAAGARLLLNKIVFTRD